MLTITQSKDYGVKKCVKMVKNYTGKRCKDKEVVKLLSKLYVYSC